MSTANGALTPELASRFARLALAHVEREYPNKLDHVMTSADDIAGPRALHPVFFGSFDWHSCVHGYWMLATVLRLFPRCAEAAEIRALFHRRLTADAIAIEVEYASHPAHAGFERPYGWAWALMLAAELHRHASDEGRLWFGLLKPLTSAFLSRFTSFLPHATYPVRVGTHYNTAFAIALALEYADTMRDKRFGRLLRGRATHWYESDVDCQAWEPSADDFLSPALIEAECMRRVLERDAFAGWLERFLPRIAERSPSALFTPAVVSDRSDGKTAHLDGLNLSRAWCWRALDATWDDRDPRRAIVRETVSAHLGASLPHVAGEYAGEHWLATFALLALI